MEELKPCPLCGGKMVISKSHCITAEGERTGYSGYCVSCGMRTRTKFSEAEAIADTNRRAAPENKAMMLEDGFDITNADGTPIDYETLGQKYKDRLCYCDIDGFYIGQNGELVLMDDCGETVSIDRGDYHIETRKPEK